jgi:Undecaprenyl-phosphate glucose phosphotransferase
VTTGSNLKFDVTAQESVEENLDESRVSPSLKTVEKGKFSSPRENIVQVNRQYTPSDKLSCDGNFGSINESRFLRPYGKSKFVHEPGLPRSNKFIDMLVTMLCFASIHFLYLGSLEFTSERAVALFSSIIFVLLSLSAGGIYNTKRLHSLNSELTKLLVCWACAFAAIGLFAFLTKTAEEVSRVWVTTSLLFSLISLAAVRTFVSLWFAAGNSAGVRNVVICGHSERIRPVMQSLYGLASSEVRVARIFEFSSDHSGESRTGAQPIVSTEQITKFVEKQRQSGSAIEQVWIAVSEDQAHIVEELSRALVNNSTVDVCVVPDLYTERLLNGEVNRVGETKIVNVSEVSLAPAADQFKRVFDVCLATIALVALCIPMAVIALLVKLESPGPALFRQKRYGVDGQEIEIFKFRSMVVHSDNRVEQATRNDARVTRVGKVLRSTSLDELPQLINVLKGTMSLVGPRPHAVAHNEIWRHQIQGYMLRHKVRPGITGWAQVHGWRGETDTAFKMQQRVKFDLEYIRNWSPWLDLKILLFTVIKGFRNENAY